MEILSYCKDDSKELLVDHISAALEIVNPNSRLFRFAGRYADFERAVRLAVVFHDSGKVFYQKRGRNGMSFMGHEYFSTYIFSSFINKLFKLDLENCDGLLRDAVTFTIFFHHHAMNVKLRKPKIDEKAVELGVSLLDTFVGDVEQFLTAEESDALKGAVEAITSQKPEDIANGVVNYVEERIRAVWREIMVNPKLKRLSYATLLALTTADYLSAQKNRKSGRTRFSAIVDEFYRFYIR